MALTSLRCCYTSQGEVYYIEMLCAMSAGAAMRLPFSSVMENLRAQSLTFQTLHNHLTLTYPSISAEEKFVTEVERFPMEYISDGIASVSSELFVNVVADVATAGDNVYHLPLEAIRTEQKDVFIMLQNRDVLYSTFNASTVLRSHSVDQALESKESLMDVVSDKIFLHGPTGTVTARTPLSVFMCSVRLCFCSTQLQYIGEGILAFQVVCIILPVSILVRNCDTVW